MKRAGEGQALGAWERGENNQLFLQPQRLVEILLFVICFLD